MKEKAYFMIFHEFFTKQLKPIFLEGENPTLNKFLSHLQFFVFFYESFVPLFVAIRTDVDILFGRHVQKNYNVKQRIYDMINSYLFQTLRNHFRCQE